LSGSVQKVVLHGLAGVVQAKLGDGGTLAGMAAGALNEAVLPAMADYLEGQGVHRYNPDGSVNAEFGALLTAGSTLVGAAVGAVGGDAGLGATVASNATVNNRLLHENEKAKIKQLANGDAVLEQQLTDAACFMAQYSAGKADGDPAKAAAQAMEQAVAANTNGEYPGPWRC
jgi:filamentous hemagglutinin